LELLLGIALILLGLPFLGAVYELYASNRDRQQYAKPPGELINVAGNTVHVVMMGESQPAPTVILLSTVGAGALDWTYVQSPVAEFAPVASYDRSGYGWSNPVDTERSPEQVVSELKALLSTLSLPAPYVLVGHGLAGLYARLYQFQYPADVAAIVLLDSSHPVMVAENDTSEELRRQRNIRLFRRIGVLRRMLPRVLAFTRQMPPEDRKRYLAIRLRDVPMVEHEVVPIFRDGVDLPDYLGELPLVVVSRSLVEEVEFSHRWREFQDDFENLSSEVYRLIAEQGGHSLQIEEPDTVVNAIRIAIALARGEPIPDDLLTEADDTAEEDQVQEEDLEEERSGQDNQTS